MCIMIFHYNSPCPRIKSMFLWYQISWTASRDRVRMEPPVWREPTPSRATARPATPETAAISVRPTNSINSVCYRSNRFNTENATVGDSRVVRRVVKENKSVHEYFMSGFHLLDSDTIDFTSETH